MPPTKTDHCPHCRVRLLHCPFCGGPAEAVGSAVVQCRDTVGCSATIDFGHWTGEDDNGVPAIHFVIEQWNKRASDEPETT